MALEIVFWAAAGLIVYAPLGYPLLLWGLSPIFGGGGESLELGGEPPRVSLVIPAYDEEGVIERQAATAHRPDYPGEPLENIGPSDRCGHRTADLAGAAAPTRTLQL